MKNVFDKEAVQSELDLQVQVTQAFDQNRQAAKAEINKAHDTAKAQLDAGEITQAEYDAKVAQLNGIGFVLDSVASGLSTPSNSVSGSLIATASPLVTQKVGELFKTGGALYEYEGTVLHGVAQGVVAAAVAAAGDNNALSAGLAAGSAEVLAPKVSQFLYGTSDADKLTSEQKQTVSAILGMAGSALGATVGNSGADVVVSGGLAQNAVENNSLHIDKNGVVIRNIPNNDYNIYQYNYTCSTIAGNNCPNLTDFNKLYNSSKKVVGQIMWQDSFTSPESGKSFGIIHLGENIESYIYQLNDKAWGQSDITVGWKSRSGGEYDIKNNYPNAGSYHGFLFQGKYITLRDAGNILAGMNAAVNGKSFDDFQKASGALQQGGIPAVINNRTTGKTYGPPPMYGELSYQYHKSKYGYNLGLDRLRINNNINNMIPNNMPSIGDIFNGIR